MNQVWVKKARCVGCGDLREVFYTGCEECSVLGRLLGVCCGYLRGSHVRGVPSGTRGADFMRVMRESVFPRSF